MLGADASLAKFYSLLVEYAQEKGGLTLPFWQTFLGAAFAHESVRPTVRTDGPTGRTPEGPAPGKHR